MISSTADSIKNREEVANLLMDGFLDKFQRLKLSENDLSFFVSCLAEHILKNHSDHLLKVGDKDIHGILFVKPRKWKARQIGRELFKKLGFPAFLKIWIFLLALDHRCKKKEIHIDLISVSRTSRGKGIGTQLIERLKNKIDANQYITLFVSAKNISAKRLYKRQGFQIKKTGTSIWGSNFHGIDKWYLMEWRGTKVNEKKN